MTVAYVFVVDGDFKLFLSELIARQFCQDGDHHLVSFSPDIQENWDLYPWKTRTLLPWVHKGGNSVFKKYVGLRKRLHTILGAVEEVSQGADHIVLHMYQIYSERTNYMINHLRKRYPAAKLSIRLLPDGERNLKIRRLTGIRRLASTVNQLKWMFDKDINYYCYSGDRLGSDADIVDRIYLPKGFPHPYTNGKVRWIEMPATLPASNKLSKALVVGTALTQIGLCSKQDMALVAARICRYLTDKGVKEIWYKPHHTEPLDQLELWSPGYRLLESKKGIERLLLTEQFDCIVGQCSTALITSKLILSELSVTSCGLDIAEARSRPGSGIQSYRAACKKLGIELIPVMGDAGLAGQISKAA